MKHTCDGDAVAGLGDIHQRVIAQQRDVVRCLSLWDSVGILLHAIQAQYSASPVALMLLGPEDYSSILCCL